MPLSAGSCYTFQDSTGNGEIDRFEFCQYLLKLWGQVDDSVLNAIQNRFKVWVRPCSSSSCVQLTPVRACRSWI